MATLQKLRNTGPLLIIFVGIALLAFVIGDALRIFQSPQGAQAVGSVNGKEISAADYQQKFEEYSNIVRFMRGGATMNEQEQQQLKDEVWNTYLTEQIINKEAEAIGLTVTAAELQAIVAKGEAPILRQSPFRNEQGNFDIDGLNMFLAQYEDNKDNPDYQVIYEYWKFVEKTLMQNALTEKYQALIANSFISNPVVAEYVYNTNNATYDVEIKAYPYSAIADSLVKVADNDIKKAYEEEKAIYKQYAEGRDIKYVSFRITPSTEDRNALKNEVQEYTDSLATSEDYATIVRLSNSNVPYTKIAWAKDIYPEEIQVRLDSVKENEVVGPIYNLSDDSYTSFKLLGQETIADSVLYRTLAVLAETPEKTEALADSLLNVLENGADFKELAAKYGQTNSDSLWLTSAMYEGAALQAADETFISTLLNGVKGKYGITSIDNMPNKVIYQVIDTKNPETKYHVAVVKRTSEFSSETYNDAYNKFSQFVATCKTVDELEKNAEEYGYRVMTQNNLFNSAYNIANITDTRDAIRWIFNEAEVGEVSPLYPCGNNDNLLVVALTRVNEKGYMPLDRLSPMLRTKVIKEKKAEKIMAELNGKSFDELANNASIKSDAVKRITFSAPAYISATASSEPAICAAVVKLQPGEVSAPIKGEGGVYVLKLTAKNTKSGEFNATTEQSTLKTQAQRNAARFMSDLFEKADVEDNRYLYF